MKNKQLVFPQLFIKSSHSIFESTISMDQIIEFSIKNSHKHSFFTESQYIKHFPTFHLKASNKGLIPLLSLHYIWENSSEWLLIPKNTNGYFSLCKFTKKRTLSEEEWNEIFKIFISGDDSLRPWKSDNSFLSNSDCSKGIYVRENLFLKEDDYELFSLVIAIKNKSNFLREIELNKHLESSHLLNNNSKSNNKFWIKNLINILKECKSYSIRPKLVKNSQATLQKKKKMIDFCSSRLIEYSNNLSIELKEEYKRRFEREIKLFNQSGNIYWDYFFVIWELVKYLSSQDILIGPGRGSSCSSLFLFLLGINHIDPIKHDLLLDRFLNESSDRMPDLDIDIEGSKRVKALNFLKDKFGENNFIIPSVLKKIRNINLISSTLSKIIPDQEKVNKRIISKLIDIPFLIQPHPSSIIPLFESSQTFWEYTYKYPNCVFPVAPLEYSTASHIGIQKFDLLSSQYLEFISEINKEIGWKNSQIFEIDFLDENTWNLLNKGLNYYLFHLDSSLIKRIIPLFKLRSISDLAQLLAIIRPGINKHISKFLNFNTSNNTFSPFLIKDLLIKTRGIILFQEQIMKIVSKISGISLSRSDKYRIAFQKEKSDELISLKKEFFQLSMEKNRKVSDIHEIWNFINTFAKYSFNKSHAIAYATLSFQAAYLKANYTEQFFFAVIKREGLTKNFLEEIISLGYQIKVMNCMSKEISYTGYFSSKEKIFHIGLNGIKFGGLQLFQLLKKIEFEIVENCSNLKSLVSFLLSKGITQMDIQKLNYLNWFSPIFSKNETALYLEYNWDSLYKDIVFDVKQKNENNLFSEIDKKNFSEKRNRNLIFEWERYFSKEI